MTPKDMIDSKNAIYAEVELMTDIQSLLHLYEQVQETIKACTSAAQVRALTPVRSKVYTRIARIESGLPGFCDQYSTLVYYRNLRPAIRKGLVDRWELETLEQRLARHVHAIGHRPGSSMLENLSAALEHVTQLLQDLRSKDADTSKTTDEAGRPSSG